MVYVLVMGKDDCFLVLMLEETKKWVDFWMYLETELNNRTNRWICFSTKKY